MNGEIGDFQNGFFRLPQFWCVFLSILEHNLTSQNQVSIKPSMPQSSTISRNMKLFGCFEFSLWDWSQSETWTVSVSTNNFKSGIRWVERFTNIECNKCSVISGKEIFWSFFEFPVLCFAQLLPSFLSEFISAPIDNMEGWLWNVNEI